MKHVDYRAQRARDNNWMPFNYLRSVFHHSGFNQECYNKYHWLYLQQSTNNITEELMGLLDIVESAKYFLVRFYPLIEEA
jgi:hypothetical protein